MLLQTVPVSSWRFLERELLWVYDGPKGPTADGKSVTLDHSAWLLRKGSVHVSWPAGDVQAEAGQWLFPPILRRVQRFSDDAELLSVHFRARWPTGANLIVLKSGVVLDPAEHPDIETHALALLEFVQTHMRTLRADADRFHLPVTTLLDADILFAQWLQAVVVAFAASQLGIHHPGAIDSRILKVAGLIREGARGKPLADAELAMRVGLSVSHLRRLFATAMGHSIGRHHTLHRMEALTLEVSTSDIPLKALADEYGFSSTAHFTGWFRHHVGQTPGEFRRSQQRHPLESLAFAQARIRADHDNQ